MVYRKCNTVADAFHEVFDLVKWDRSRIEAGEESNSVMYYFRGENKNFKCPEIGASPNFYNEAAATEGIVEIGIITLTSALKHEVKEKAEILDVTEDRLYPDFGAGTVLTSGSGTWTATTDSNWIVIKPRTTGDAGVSGNVGKMAKVEDSPKNNNGNVKRKS